MHTDAIATARSFLPAWVVWFPVVTFAFEALASVVLSAAAIAYASRPLRRLQPDAHWTERARLVWPARRALALAWVLAILASGPLAVGGPLSRPGTLGRWVIGPVVALLAGLAGAFTFEDRWVRKLPLLTRFRSVAGYVLLVFPAYWVSGAFAIWATQRHLSLASSLAAGSIVVVLALGIAPWLGRAIGLVNRAPPRAREALALAQQRLGGPPARLVILPIASANAAAFQLTRTIGITQGALDQLDDAELGALLAHELGHLSEPPAVVLLRTAVATFIPVSLVIFPWVFELRSEWSWLALWLFVVAVVLVYRRLQRALERRADAVGVAVTPTYAAALEKVYRTNLTPAVLQRTATHPALFDRMLAAGATPAWPRPRPPPSFLPVLVVLIALAGAAFAGAWQVRALVERTAQGDGWRDLALLVAMEGRASDTGRLGYWHLQQHDENAALALFRAAEAMDDSDATWPALVATVLSYQGHCEEAGEASTRATSRNPSSPYARAADGLVAACGESRK